MGHVIRAGSEKYKVVQEGLVIFNVSKEDQVSFQSIECFFTNGIVKLNINTVFFCQLVRIFLKVVFQSYMLAGPGFHSMDPLSQH